MFFFRKLMGVLFLSFLLLGIFGFLGHIGQDRSQAAYRQGFMAGQQAAASGGEAAAAGVEEAAPAAPVSYPGTKVYYRGHGFFFPGFGLLFCALPFFFLGFLFMAFGKRRWYGHGRCGHGGWQQGPGGRGEDWAGKRQEKSPDDIDDGPEEPIMRA
jgi:hypothetical protein